MRTKYRLTRSEELQNNQKIQLDKVHDLRSFRTRERPDDSNATPPRTTSLTGYGETLEVDGAAG